MLGRSVLCNIVNRKGLRQKKRKEAKQLTNVTDRCTDDSDIEGWEMA